MQSLDPHLLRYHAPLFLRGSFDAVSTSFIIALHFFMRTIAASMISTNPRISMAKNYKMGSNESATRVSFIQTLILFLQVSFLSVVGNPR